jgi:hypothetical protein
MVSLDSFMSGLLTSFRRNGALSVQLVDDNAHIIVKESSKVGKAADACSCTDSSHRNRWGSLEMKERGASILLAPHRVPSTLTRSSSDSTLALNDMMARKSNNNTNGGCSTRISNETWNTEICSPPRPPGRTLSPSSALSQLGRKSTGRRCSFPPNTSNSNAAGCDAACIISNHSQHPRVQQQQQQQAQQPNNGMRSKVDAKRAHALRNALGAMAPGSSGGGGASGASKTVAKSSPISARHFPRATVTWAF